MKRITMSSIIVAAALLLAACVSSAPPNPLVGMWDISIDTPVGVMGATIDVKPDLTGTMFSDDLGAATLDNVMSMDNSVTFKTTVDAQGQMLTLDFTGTIAGDTLAGNFDTDFGAIAVTGVRK